MSMEGESNTVNSVEPKKRKGIVERSDVWQHFTKLKNEQGIVIRSQCNHCGTSYARDHKRNSGTSNLRQHLLRCASYLTNNSGGQSNIAVTTEKDEETGESKVILQAFRFDQKKGRRAIVEMLCIDQLSFSFVENEGFKRFVKILQPAFVVPSRSTVTRDCLKLYMEEKAKLKAQLKKSTLRVCFTTDTWTSLQRINYMCLTAHYVDENWCLQKKLINFCPISSHRGKDIGKAVETCLDDWNLQNVMTITVDNASSNDVAIEYLVGKMVKWGDRCILKGKWTHVRCMAHVMNLIVQDGLKELGTSIYRIRSAVRWVRLGTARLKDFRKYVALEKVDCQLALTLDVPTRWNSTYLMLSVATQYEKVFDRFIEDNLAFSRDLIEGSGVPTATDWENAKRLGGFLRHFYELTLRVSGTKYITSNTYLDSISCVDAVLKQCMLSEDDKLAQMANSMRSKFDKYWGDVKKFNMLVFIASLFDPRTKLDYLKLDLRGMYGNEVGDEVCALCEKTLLEIFNDYKRIHSEVHVNKVSSTSNKTMNEETDSGNTFNLYGNVDDTIRASRERKMAEVKRRKAEFGVAEDSKTELDRYLKEEIEGDALWFEREDFTVLGWWKKRSPAFPILSFVARDILAIPISTVASESTFSTGGRLLDSFRSSLNAKTVEALICSQDWLRQRGVPMNVEENIENLDKLIEDMENEMLD